MNGMKLTAASLAALLLSACAFTETSITDPDTGQVFSMKTRTLLKDVKDAKGHAHPGGFNFELGQSSRENTTQLACILAPHLEGCKP